MYERAGMLALDRASMRQGAILHCLTSTYMKDNSFRPQRRVAIPCLIESKRQFCCEDTDPMSPFSGFRDRLREILGCQHALIDRRLLLDYPNCIVHGERREVVYQFVGLGGRSESDAPSVRSIPLHGDVNNQRTWLTAIIAKLTVGSRRPR